MSMKLIQNSGIPIYQQIADAFRSDILSGKMQQGEYLPSIRDQGCADGRNFKNRGNEDI